MAYLTYAHTGATAFSTKATLDAADLNDNFLGSPSTNPGNTTTGIAALLNPSGTIGGLNALNIAEATAGFLPFQFKDPYGSCIITGRPINTIAAPTANRGLIMTGTTGGGNSEQLPLYLVCGAFECPENGYLTRLGCYFDAATNYEDDIEPLNLVLLQNTTPVTETAVGTRRFKLRNRWQAGVEIASLSGGVGTAGGFVETLAEADIGLPVSAGDQILVVLELNDNHPTAGTDITLNFTWWVQAKFLQRGDIKT